MARAEPVVIMLQRGADTWTPFLIISDYFRIADKPPT
jgi:hypothetical protein